MPQMPSLPFNFKFAQRKKKRSVNNSCAFNRLPYEIFRRIILYADDRVSSRLLLSMAKSEIIPPPITASHVCRSWRAALLSDPTLWTCLRIPQMEPRQIKEMLRRSAHVPLNVFMDTSRYAFNASFSQWKVYQNEVLPSVFKEMSRFKSFRMDFSLHSHYTFRALANRVLELLDQPAPILQEFYLTIGTTHREQFYESVKTLMRNMLSDTPNLKHLYRQVLDDFRHLSFPSHFRNLYSLHLELGEGVVICCDTFFDVLESSPFLRTLQIVAFCEPTLIPPASAARRVSLPHLQSLSITQLSDVHVADLVFRHLVFPEEINYDIDCSNYYRELSHTSSLLRFITQRRPTDLNLSFPPSGRPVFTTFNYLGLHTNTLSMNEYVDSQHEDSLHNLLQIFTLSDVTSLNLRFADGSTNPPDNLVNTFPLLINLKFLHIRYDFWDTRCRTIITASILTLISFPPYACWVRDGGPSNDEIHDALLNPQYPSCPLLHTLSIAVDRDCSQLDKTYATVLKACSQFRRRAGYPLEAIIIRCSKSSLTEAAAAMLLPRRGFPVTINLEENLGSHRF